MSMTDNKGRNLLTVPIDPAEHHGEAAVLAVTLVASDGTPLESPIKITVPGTPGTYTFTLP